MKKVILTTLLSILLIFAIGYLDFVVISPLFLPEDLCFYHMNEAPFLINLFYLGNGMHPEPPYNGLHLSLLVGGSIVLSYLIIKKFSKK